MHVNEIIKQQLKEEKLLKKKQEEEKDFGEFGPNPS